ncbi:MAG: M56 family metallopeptidase [Mucilaginibacter sp.]
MIDYIIKSAICLAALLMIYHLLLEKEKMHVFNRYFLLTSILFSLAIPLITIHTSSPQLAHINYAEIIHPRQIAETGQYVPSTNIQQNTVELNWQLITVIIYITGALLMLGRFFVNLFRITRCISQNETIKEEDAVIVLTGNKIVPHSFWRYIFFNKDDHEQSIPQELYLHELTHIREKHSLDILLIEFLQIIFWFNPIFILYKKAIRLNHEFLADDSVLNHFHNITTYQQLLLDMILFTQPVTLSSNLTYSLTKKRMIMMKKITPRSKAITRKIALIPLFAMLVFLFSNKAAALQDVKTSAHPAKNPIVVAMDGDRDTYYKGAFVKYRDDSGAVVTKKYDDMTAAEKSTLPMPIMFPAPRKRTPSQAYIDAWESSDVFGVWVDGKQIANKELANYKPADFVMYFDSRLMPNARHYGNRKFQIDLYSADYYQKVFLTKPKYETGRKIAIVKGKTRNYAVQVSDFSEKEMKSRGLKL